MIEDIQKGDKKLVKLKVVDDASAAVLFANLNSLTCVLKHVNGTSYATYTKGSADASTDIVVGDTTNELEFEVVVAQSNLFTEEGIINGIFTFNIPDTNFSSNEFVDNHTIPLLRVKQPPT